MTYETRPARLFLLTTVLLLGLQTASGVGCDSAIDLDNGVPRVTWVAVEPADDPVTQPARVTLWVQDVEGDSVDVLVEWDDGQTRAPLTQRVGSYGLVGLTTREALFDPNGQPHLVLWDVAELSPDATVKLRFTPDDRPFDSGGKGPTVETPSFRLSDGLPDPVVVVPAQ